MVPGSRCVSRAPATTQRGGNAGQSARPLWSCWGAASPTSLKANRTGIRKLSEAYPQYWPRIYVADVLMRSNMWDRLLEQRLDAEEVTLETP